MAHLCSIFFLFAITPLAANLLFANREIYNFVVEDAPTKPDTIRSFYDKKPWTIILYIAGDNDLHPFIWHNIKQLAKIGTNNICNIVVQVNEAGKNKPTQRYLIEKGRALLLNKEQVDAGIKLDSGSDQTLVDFVSFCIDEFPSEHTALILWNHGSGYLDPGTAKIINPAEFFDLNPASLMLEVNRNIEFIEALILKDLRGIAFDETHKTYLNNVKLTRALQALRKKMNRPFDIIGLDACLMAMVEFGLLLEPYANIMVASEEVELGWGWNYATALARLATENITPIELAHEIVKSYQEAYKNITPDFTLSACNLRILHQLDKNISLITQLLIECLKNQKNQSVKKTIQLSRNKKNCTCFEEPSYVDLGHFYKNLKNNLESFDVVTEKKHLIEQINSALTRGSELIKQTVFSMANGKKLFNATGLSIYFPEKYIHSSYRSSSFAQQNPWINLLVHYLS